MRGRQGPEWAEHVIWWQVYPLGFCGAPIRDLPQTQEPARHRLSRLVPWLDYAIELGCSGLLLGPIFAASTHGYDTVDHLRVDPRLGDDRDVEALLEEAKARGMRLVLDGVFNHVGREHPAFRRVLEQGPEAPEADWFHLTWPSQWSPGVQPEYAKFEGHGGLVELNHATGDVEDLVVTVMCHWLDRGFDGWRLDAAYAVDPDFWARVLPRVRERHPEAWFVGEVIHGDYSDLAERGTLDSVTQYELWKAIWSSLLDANFHELAWALVRHEEFVQRFDPQTFVGNHDVTRLATRLKDERLVVAAVTVLLTVAGIPSVYYGDEQAFHGEKTTGWSGDDQVRPVFPESPVQLSTLGSWAHGVHRTLIGIRRRHPWLVRARTDQRSVTNERFVYVSRDPDSDESITVELDLGGTPAVRVRGADGSDLFTF